MEDKPDVTLTYDDDFWSISAPGIKTYVGKNYPNSVAMAGLQSVLQELNLVVVVRKHNG